MNMDGRMDGGMKGKMEGGIQGRTDGLKSFGGKRKKVHKMGKKNYEVT